MPEQSNDSLQAAITALQNALGQVRTLVAENRGDGLYFAIENELAAAIYNLITRQANLTAAAAPPHNPANTAFYA